MAVNEALRGDVVRFIRKATEGETGFKLQEGEARTSLFVFFCLDQLLEYDPFDGEIIPQSCNRGFVDYELRPKAKSVECWVEVKRFGAPLKAKYIRKYLVREG